MPIYAYTCDNGHHSDFLCAHRDRPNFLDCLICGGLMRYDVRRSMQPARTASKWGDSGGYYDRGLGQYVANSGEREAAMKRMGVVHESDHAPGTFDDTVHDAITVREEHTRDMNRLDDAKKRHPDNPALAFTEAFPGE